MRLTPADHRTKSEVVAEISFMDYLARKDFPLAVPVVSKNGLLVEEINFRNNNFFATVFKKIDGIRASDEESLQPSFLFKWGAYLAQLHDHSIAFGNTEASQHRRPEWEFDTVKVKAMSFSKSLSSMASVRLQECVDWLLRLEKENENYGLIHGDLHRGNFFVVDGKIVSFDYDDSCYHWFLYDTAACLSTVLKIAKNESDRQQIIAAFFNGYESVRSVSQQWKSRFECFYQYRLALVFNWMNAMISEGRFSSHTIENWKSVEPWYLENMKRQIDFRELKMKIGVSACLLGEQCNFNGKDLLSEFVNELGKISHVEFVRFCPEDAVFGSPRPNLRIVGGDGFDVLDGKASVIDEHNQDVTKAQIEGAHQFLRRLLAAKVKCAILMDGSPSCGSNVLLKEDNWPAGGLKRGVGVAAALLRRNGIVVFSSFDQKSIAELLAENIDGYKSEAGLLNLKDIPKFKVLFQDT